MDLLAWILVILIPVSSLYARYTITPIASNYICQNSYVDMDCEMSISGSIEGYLR